MSEFSNVLLYGVDFEIRCRDEQPAQFLFGVRKSGSSIMNAMVESVARMNHVHYVDVAGRLFERGIRVAAWQNDAALGGLLHGGNLYGGFRNAPLGIATHPLLLASPKVLLVRDPRDALVSEYFSNAYSHAIPEQGAERDLLLKQRSEALRSSIAEYVVRMAPSFRNTLREYAPFLEMPGLRLFRYETAILDKARFLRDLCAHFGWSLSDVQIGQILSWADVVPKEENPTSFIRKVHPGDHLEKLDGATIAKLNRILAGELARLGYAE